MEFNKEEVEASHILIKTVDDNNKEPSKDKKRSCKEKKRKMYLKKLKVEEILLS